MPFADTLHFARAAHAVDTFLAAVTSEQWTAPTPCKQWNLADLTQHLIDVNHSFRRNSPTAPAARHPSAMTRQPACSSATARQPRCFIKP